MSAEANIKVEFYNTDVIEEELLVELEVKIQDHLELWGYSGDATAKSEQTSPAAGW